MPEIFRDGFSRTTVSGLGTADDAIHVYTAPGGDDNAHVNGAQIAQTSSGFSHYEGLPSTPSGAVMFDFFTTSNRNDTNLLYGVRGGFDLQPSSGLYYPLFAQAVPDGFSGSWTIACSNHFFSTTLLASTWYRVRVEWDGVNEQIKIWRVVDAEPGTWNASGSGATYGSGGPSFIEISGPSSTARTAMVDNVVIESADVMIFTVPAGIVTVVGIAPIPNGIIFVAETGLVTIGGIDVTPREIAHVRQTVRRFGYFTDDFNRAVPQGLGNGWVWTNDDSFAADADHALASVFGNVISLPNNRWESYTHPDAPFSAVGSLQFDFWVPAILSDGTIYAFNMVPDEFFVGAYNAITGAFTDDWLVSGWNHVFGSGIRFSPTASSWYTVKFEFGGVSDRAKVWLRGDPEPGSWTDIGVSFGTYGDHFFLDINHAPIHEEAQLDNVIVGGDVDAPAAIVVSGPNVGPARFAPAPGVIDVKGRRPQVEQGWPGPPIREPIGNPANEVWSFTLGAAVTGGTFTLVADAGLGDSGAIPWNATASVLLAILSSSWGAGISVTGSQLPGGTLRIEFGGSFAHQRFVVRFGTMALTMTGGGPAPAPPPPIEEQLGQPGGFGDDGHGNPAIQILVGGHDLTRRILYRDAFFVSATNGDVGPCHFRVRDLDPLNRLSTAIRTGDEIFVRFKGINQWQGFVRQVGYAYSLSAGNVESNPERFFVIEGADVNILFNSRTVFNQADPAGEGRKLYPIKKGPTKDITAIEELVAHWVNISGDSIDAESMVDHVGFINVDQDAVPWTAGMRWGDAMKSIALLPAAVFCLDPDRRLVYADVDKPSSPYEALSDHQSKTTAPYREMEIVFDGSDLVTDVMAWGIGTGSKVPVFKRLQSDPDGHGLWQDGELRFDVYKQSTIDRIATSIIEGSPSSHRGRKRDKIAVKVTTFVPGYRAGQRVVFRSYAWDFYDVIPIRQMKITFPTPSMPKFELTMSHEIDAPWSFYDVFDFTAQEVSDRSYLVLPEAQDYSYPIHTGRDLLVTCRTPTINTPIFVDDFARVINWTVDWGDGGCGPWGAPVNVSGNHFAKTVVKSPAPHCFAIASGPFDLLIQSGGDSALNNPYSGSWQVTVTVGDDNLTLFAAPGVQGVPGSGAGIPSFTGVVYGYHGDPDVAIPASIEGYVVRVVRDQTTLRVRVWALGDKEPSWWHAEMTPVKGSGEFDGYGENTEDDFVGGIPMGGLWEVGTRGVFGIYVSGGVGWGWVWYEYPLTDSASHVNSVAEPWPTGYTHTFAPLGMFPVNPDIVGAVQPIDAVCTSVGVPLFDIDAGRPDSATAAGPSALASYVLNSLIWAWNSDNGLAGTIQEDGRLIADTQWFNSFIAPPGAYQIHLRFRVVIAAPETGEFGLGSQPGPSGEGSLDFEIWSAKYAGEDRIHPNEITHTVIASGTLDDYHYGPTMVGHGDDANITENFLDFDLTLPIKEFEVFQLGGRILNDYQSLILTHGPADSFPANSGGSRRLELTVVDMKMSFSWAPEACIDDAQYGEVSISIDGITSPLIYLGSPYWDGTTKVFKNGGILARGHEADALDEVDADPADYMETSPLDGTITLTDDPVPGDTFVIVFRGSSDTGWAGLPKEIKIR